MADEIPQADQDHTKNLGGRPPFAATKRQCKRVEEMISCGMSEPEISHVIGCSVPTLRKHFADHLMHGRARRRAEVIELLYKTARKGNVSAQKQLEDMTAVAASLRPSMADVAEVPKPVKLGKKEEADQAAANPDASTPLGELMQRRQNETVQ